MRRSKKLNYNCGQSDLYSENKNDDWKTTRTSVISKRKTLHSACNNKHGHVSSVLNSKSKPPHRTISARSRLSNLSNAVLTLRLRLQHGRNFQFPILCQTQGGPTNPDAACSPLSFIAAQCRTGRALGRPPSRPSKPGWLVRQQIALRTPFSTYSSACFHHSTTPESMLVN